MINRWWQSLSIQIKLTLMIQLSLAAVLIPTQRWLMTSFENRMQESAHRRAAETADGIINGMNMLMVTGQVSDPNNRILFINKMKQSQSIRELRIFRSQQVVQQYGPGLPEEQPVDEVDLRVLATGKPWFDHNRETGMLRAVIPFIASHNFRGTDCLSCHQVREGSVNGAASIIFDLQEDVETLKLINLWLWLGQIVLQIILYIVIGMMIRSFTAPVLKLQRAMSEMQKNGDLSQRVDIRSNDEIGKMARVFNAMAESLQKNVLRMRENERQLSLSAQVFMNSSEAILISDANNNIMQVNRAFTELTGYTAEEVIGKNPRILKSGQQDSDFYRKMWESLNRTGSWQGELMDRRKDGEIYPKWMSINQVRNAQGRVTNYIALFSDITERKASYERIQYLAHYDALTHLPNRTLLNDRIDHAIADARRYQKKIAILFLDLDRFKNVNDSMGHHAGDLLLQTVAERLKGSTRESDTVSRLGGDEFVILLNGIEDENDAVSVAHKVIRVLSIPIPLEGSEVNIGASLGISIYPENGTDSATLIKNADAAMYHAKENGRNQFQFFSPSMNEKAYEQIAIENDLRRALRNQEFFLQYQPQVDLASGAIVGVEALIRWRHPEHGLVSPGRFIPIAEECGLIVPIGEWVLNTACAQIKQWQDQNIAHIPVAVNLSAMQFRQTNILATIAKALDSTGLNPAYLELEITEGVTMNNVEETVHIMNQIKDMGVMISIDDFGTGYSSLSYLKRFPLDKLKVDQSFMQDITTDANNAAIVRTIIGMGHSLRLNVIAEGVETSLQYEWLQQANCNEAQGNYISPPLNAKDLAVWIAQRT